MQLCPHGLHRAFSTPLYEPSQTLHKGTVPVKILNNVSLFDTKAYDEMLLL